MRILLRHCVDWGIGSMDKIKLKWRIFAYLLGFCSLLLLILWLFQTVFLSDMYKLIRKREIEQAIQYVEKNINNSDIQLIFHELEEDKDILVKLSNEFIMPSGIRQGDRHRQETITRTKEFTLNDGRIVSLTFHAIITPVEATVTTLQMQLYIITGIMLLLSVILAIIIAKRISKPIEHINNSAKILASGSYDTYFSGTGFLEITELSGTLNTAARELSKVEALRRELMANISHDLRTPLALIYSYAEMMHDFPTEITPDQTQTIMDETNRLTSLVNDVLDISKLESGATELNIEKYNLTNSIRVTVERIAEMTKKDGYSLSFEYEGDVYVAADEVKITQVFYNLLINAINYSGTDKRIIILQHVINNYVKIEVKDFGEGIEPNSLPYIWDRYYKEDKKHRRALTGTGLGLSIVKKIINLHGGSYGVESEVGKGSSFWFYLKLSLTD